MPDVKHPSFPSDVRTVDQSQLKDYTDAGWIEVPAKKGDSKS